MSHNNLIFRPATLADLDVTFEVYRQVCLWLYDTLSITNQWDREPVREEIRELVNSGELYLVLRQNEVAGVFKLNEKDHHWADDGSALYVHAFAVNRKFKGLGIGQAMLNWAADEGRRRGKQFMRLDCMNENARLKQVYLDAGMEPRPQNPQYDWSALFERKLT
jgi:ribosomal protein S18 acetylase RimI-like enzyme